MLKLVIHISRFIRHYVTTLICYYTLNSYPGEVISYHESYEGLVLNINIVNMQSIIVVIENLLWGNINV